MDLTISEHLERSALRCIKHVGKREDAWVVTSESELLSHRAMSYDPTP